MTAGRRLAAMLALLALTACADRSLESLRHAVRNGTPYQNMLARFYLNMANDEDQAGHYSTASFLADKGLQAAYGKDVAPEVPDHWKVAGDTLGAMEKAHGSLTEALTPSAMEVQPELAAEALVHFDCWVVFSERDPLSEDSLNCRDKMAAALIKLHAPGTKQAIPSLQKKPVIVPAAADRSRPFSPPKDDTARAVKTPTDSADYIIFFGWSQWTLTDAGDAVVDEVVKSLQGEAAYEVVLSGHTDRSGPDKYNLWLSKKRAEVVKHRLIEQGVRPGAIKTFAYGESDPRIPTEDGVREAGNRRVEIELQ